MKSLLSIILCILIFSFLSRDKSTASIASIQPIKIATSFKAPVIGEIKSKMNTGCGCSFSFVNKRTKNHRPVFDSDSSDTATMNIDGQDVVLQKISSASNSKKRTTINKYKHKDIIVTLYSSVIKYEYEGANVKVKIVAERGGKTGTVLVQGYCGC
jgi:hypothetical protein